MTTAILWFRRDLRLTDNPALQTALATCSRLLPVYIDAADEESPWQPGEEGALIRLARFLEDALADYATGRDVPAPPTCTLEKLAPGRFSAGLSPTLK